MNFEVKNGKKERFLVKNAFIFGMFFLLIIIVMSVFFVKSFIDGNEKKTVDNAKLNINTISNMSEEAFFETIRRVRYVTTDMDISRLWSENLSEELFFQYSVDAKEYLAQMLTFDESIDSAYLYCPDYNYVITSEGANPIEIFDDDSWIESFDSASKNEIKVMHRQKRGSMDVVTFVMKNKTGNGGVVINLDLDKHMDFEIDSYTVLLVNENNDIIYKNNYSLPDKRIDKVLRKKSGIVNHGGVYYAIARKSSEICDFDYILMQSIPDYRISRFVAYAGVVILFALLIAVAVFVAFYLAGITYKPIREIAEIIENPSSEKAKMYLSNDATTKKIADSIAKMATNNEKLRDDLNKRMGVLNYAQLKALQWQINPHFIFNTLNMMYLMSDDIAGSKSRLTKGILSLSGLMRYCLKTEPLLVELYDEMCVTNEYIKLMNSRYGDRFEIIDGIDRKFYEKKVTKMCLQPILENCFQYGLKDIDYMGRITVSASEDGDFFVLSVEDNGTGMDDEKLAEIRNRLSEEPDIAEAHIGLANVHSRIVLIHGKNYGVEVESAVGKGTKVIVKFPNS